MDAATRAELDRLRRRAYGPEPDADDAALRRLTELEELVLSERAASRPRSAPAEPDGSFEPAGPDEPVGPVEPVEPDQPVEPDEPAPRRRSRAVVAVAAAIGVVAVIAAGAWLSGLAGGGPAAGPTPTPTAKQIEGREAFSFARDGQAVELMHVRLDGYFGGYIDLDSDSDTYVPAFPTSGVVDWATPLGEYYGFDLWIGSAAGLVQQEHCLLIERGPVHRSRCVPAALRHNAALVVSVPYTLVNPADRPIALDPNERLGFWWHDDESVTILVGRDPPL